MLLALSPPESTKTLRWFLISRAAFVLTVEGGLVHLAYALGKQMGAMSVSNSGIFWIGFPKALARINLRFTWRGTPPLSKHLPNVSPNSELMQAA